MRDENNPLYLSQSSRHGGSWYSNTVPILLLENKLGLVFNKNIVKNIDLYSAVNQKAI